jgi:hypothetical protein
MWCQELLTVVLLEIGGVGMNLGHQLKFVQMKLCLQAIRDYK